MSLSSPRHDLCFESVPSSIVQCAQSGAPPVYIHSNLKGHDPKKASAVPKKALIRVVKRLCKCSSRNQVPFVFSKVTMSQCSSVDECAPPRFRRDTTSGPMKASCCDTGLRDASLFVEHVVRPLRQSPRNSLSRTLKSLRVSNKWKAMQ